MKLLLILNENPPGAHDDVHHSLKVLKADGILQSYYVYPFLARMADGLSNTEVVKEIIGIAKDFRPTGILWSHTGNLFVSEKEILILKNLSSYPSMGYRDGDVYHKFYKPLPKQVITLAKMCDVSFWPGYCGMIEGLKKKGCRDIRYVPLSTDEKRFSKLRETKIIFDVVMVGNNITSIIPLKSFPGSRERKKIADHFYKKLGPRFAVFGKGWNGQYAKGPVLFNKQGEIYHSSRISLGLNNLHAKYYFSNRLPISMSSGVVMLHNYENGFGEIFKSINYPYFFKDVDQAWEIAEKLLAKSQDELDESGRKFRDFALSNFSMVRILKYMVVVLSDYHKERKAKKIGKVIPNPWINARQL